MMSSPGKIILYSSERPDLKVVMQLYFKENGSLVFDGYDTGNRVRESFGSFDYEYSFTVPVREVEKFYPLFDIPFGNRSVLLSCLKDRFGSNEGYSEMTKYMKAEGITYDTFFWH